ncbi:MAG: SPASM domain-containing protein [Bryobacteraceae bacterium]
MNPVIESLPVLILYPHSRCNCRCVMCDIWKSDRAEEISAAELQAHLDSIASMRVEWIVFSGGEPLMHSDLFRLAALARGRGIRATLLTTGLLIARYCGRIVDSIDDVIVSLDGPRKVHDAIRRVPGAFDLMAAGVRSLNGAIPVAARCTVQCANHALLRETVSAARSLGLESISFLAADLASSAFNRADGWPPDRQNAVAPARHELPALEYEIEALIAQERGRGYVLESPKKLRRIVRHFRAHHGLEEPEAPRCNAPWASAVIESGGDVRPCFFHQPIGNVKSQSLAEILNGPRAIAFRSGLEVSENPVCRRCVCSLYRAGGPARDANETTSTPRPRAAPARLKA